MLAVGLYVGAAPANDAGKSDTSKSHSAAKTITGTSGCATCDGVTTEGHNILLTAKDGTRWVLIGSGPAYENVHKVRTDGKKITATLASEPITKKDSDGKEYKEVKVSDVKIDA
jgi:hypothetical protein